VACQPLERGPAKGSLIASLHDHLAPDRASEKAIKRAAGAARALAPGSARLSPQPAYLPRADTLAHRLTAARAYAAA